MKALLVALALSQPAALTPEPWDSPLPDDSVTPGAADPRVTQDNIDKTICVPGYTKKVRPPVRVTSKIKKTVMHLYGYDGMDPRDFELDHFLPLEDGGCPDCQKNLWPQKWRLRGHRLAKFGEGAEDKDLAENWLHQQICQHKMKLEDAQQKILTDWTAVWRECCSSAAKQQ